MSGDGGKPGPGCSPGDGTSGEWTSGDGTSGEGVFGQFLTSDGRLAGVEFRVNTTTISRQIHPTIASDGLNRFLVVWSSFGAGTSFDSYFSLSYANGMVWIVDTAGGNWRGFDVGL